MSAISSLLADLPRLTQLGARFPIIGGNSRPVSFLHEFVAIDASLPHPRQPARPLRRRHSGDEGGPRSRLALDGDALPRSLRRSEKPFQWLRPRPRQESK
jgi:hypothetical protein